MKSKQELLDMDSAGELYEYADQYCSYLDDEYGEVYVSLLDLYEKCHYLEDSDFCDYVTNKLIDVIMEIENTYEFVKETKTLKTTYKKLVLRRP